LPYIRGRDKLAKTETITKAAIEFSWTAPAKYFFEGEKVPDNLVTSPIVAMIAVPEAIKRDVENIARETNDVTNLSHVYNVNDAISVYLEEEKIYTGPYPEDIPAENGEKVITLRVIARGDLHTDFTPDEIASWDEGDIMAELHENSDLFQGLHPFQISVDWSS
jgi:hypothetical protein